MSADRPNPEKPQPALTPSEASFNRWMEQFDIDSLDLERLKLQAEAHDDESVDDED